MGLVRHDPLCLGAGRWSLRPDQANISSPTKVPTQAFAHLHHPQRFLRACILLILCAVHATSPNMSKITLGIIAAASAATGAACTALYYSNTSRKATSPVPITPRSQVSRESWGPRTPGSTQSPVDPAGLFQYGRSRRDGQLQITGMILTPWGYRFPGSY